MRTLNGKILINDKGELNEQVWLENCIAVGELLAKRSKTMNDDTIKRSDAIESEQRTDGVAWMPLPAPWEGEEDEF